MPDQILFEILFPYLAMWRENATTRRQQSTRSKAEIEDKLISQRTKEASAPGKKAEMPLGTPRGHRKSKLDIYSPEKEAFQVDGQRSYFKREER